MTEAYEGAALSDDILKGLGDLALFTFGEDSSANRKKIAHQIEQNRLPIFRLGRSIYARKSALLAWVKEQEAEHSRGRPRPLQASGHGRRR